MTKTTTASFDGITLHVDDVQKSLDFYSRIPGAKVVVPIQSDEHHSFAMLQVGKGRIGLLAGVPQMQFHIELETDDLDQTYEELKTLGFSPEGPPQERPWGRRDMRLFDPDGYMVEFDQAD